MKTKILFASILISIMFAFTKSFSQTNDSLLKRIQIIEEKVFDDDYKNNNLADFDDDNMLWRKHNHPCVKIIKEKKYKHPQIIRQLPFSNKILVLAPLFTVFIIFIILCLFLKKRGFSLTQALSSKKIDEDGKTFILPSSSKLLAFLSIITGLILATFLFSYYLYFAFKHLPTPNFIGLWPIVIIIGLGIIPYIIQSIFKK